MLERLQGALALVLSALRSCSARTSSGQLRAGFATVGSILVPAWIGLVEASSCKIGGTATFLHREKHLVFFDPRKLHLVVVASLRRLTRAISVETARGSLHARRGHFSSIAAATSWHLGEHAVEQAATTTTTATCREGIGPGSRTARTGTRGRLEADFVVASFASVVGTWLGGTSSARSAAKVVFHIAPALGTRASWSRLVGGVGKVLPGFGLSVGIALLTTTSVDRRSIAAVGPGRAAIGARGSEFARGLWTAGWIHTSAVGARLVVKVVGLLIEIV